MDICVSSSISSTKGASRLRSLKMCQGVGKEKELRGFEASGDEEQMP